MTTDRALMRHCPQSRAVRYPDHVTRTRSQGKSTTNLELGGGRSDIGVPRILQWRVFIGKDRELTKRGRLKVSGRRKSPLGSRGLIGGLETKSPEAEEKIVYNCERFPVQKLLFNDYRSRAFHSSGVGK